MYELRCAKEPVDLLAWFRTRICGYGLVILPMIVVFAVGQSQAFGARSAAVYASASMKLVKASLARLPAGVTADDALLGTVQRGCRDILAGAPKGEALNILEADIEGASAVTMVKVNLLATRAFVVAVGQLKWAQKRIGQLVREELRVLRQEMEFSAPNICYDAHVWREGDFRRLPEAAVQFARKFNSLLSEPEPGAPTRAAIARYASTTVKSRLREADRLEYRVDLAQGGDWLAIASKIRTTLGLPSTT